MPKSHLLGSQGPTSFFALSNSSATRFLPHDETTHKAFSISQFLHSKLRWMTLGVQYNWTAKCYTSDQAPAFPSDIANFVQSLFPEVRAEAAIMNIYKPGDHLSMHRDVSEECEKGLVSISLGCDGIFMIALQSNGAHKPQHAVLRVRSGDVIYLNGPSRFAWHGLCQILPGTCPKWLNEWPVEPLLQDGDTREFTGWQGFMIDKRVNLSIRQVYD